MFMTTAVVLAASLLAGDVPAEKAFKEWGDYKVGDVWTSTNARGNKQENRCEWILGKNFLQMTGSDNEDFFQEVHGIDPATGRWVYWGFDSKGRVWTGTGVSEKAGEWVFQDSGQGKEGPNSWKSKSTKMGPDKLRSEVLEQTLDGKQLPPEVVILTRTKEGILRKSGTKTETVPKKEMTPAEKVFREFGAWSVGGTWFGSSGEYKVEEHWEWILDRAFLLLRGKDNYGAWVDIFGIDPATGQWTNWGMDEKGRVWKGINQSEKASEWTFRIKGQGKAGPMVWNTKAVKLGNDSKRIEYQEIVVDGKKDAMQPATMVRKR